MRCAHAPVFHIRADEEQPAIRIVEPLQFHIRAQIAHPLRKKRIPNGVCAQQQARRQIAAVHRRYVSGMHRRKAFEIIPVVQLTVPFFQLFQRFCRCAQAAQHFIGSNKAHFPRRHAGGHIQADVRGRCAHRRAHGRIDLYVVGRQTAAIQRHRGFKERPRFPRQRAKRADLPRGERILAFGGRIAQIVCPAYADEEQKRKTDGGGQPERAQQRGQHQQRGDSARKMIAPALLDVRRGHPVHQMLMRNQQPVQRARDRVCCAPRARGQHGKIQRAFFPRRAAIPNRMQDRFEVRKRHAHGECVRRIQPHGQKQYKKYRYFARAAQQIADQAHAVARGDRDLRCDHRKQLPVAANPAMRSAQIGRKVLRRAFVKGDVRKHAAAAQHTLDHIVAQNCIIVQYAIRGARKRAHGVNALARKAAASGYILPEIGCAEGIAVHAAPARHQARVGAAHGVRIRLHTGLQYRIALLHAFFHARAVHRMVHRAHKALHRAGDVFRIRIQRDDIGKSTRDVRRRSGFRGKRLRRARRIQQEPVQFHQRAALAVFAHPSAVDFAITAPAHQQMVFFRAAVQSIDSPPECG